jgi:hypothetical protein
VTPAPPTPKFTPPLVLPPFKASHGVGDGNPSLAAAISSNNQTSDPFELNSPIQLVQVCSAFQAHEL